MLKQFRKPSNAFVQSINKENNNMNQQPAMPIQPVVTNGEQNVNQPVVNTQIEAIWNARRQWEANTWGKRIQATAQEIETWSPEATFMKLFNEGRIRITQDTNGSREEGIPTVFSNNVQDNQLGAMIAIYENIPYLADYLGREDGFRSIALCDTEGDHDVQVIEERDPVSGHIRYNVFYATKAYNNHGDLVGLRRGSINKVQEGIFNKLNGWTGTDGVKHTGYNQWVDAHNSAVLKFANGDVLTAEDNSLLKNVTTVDQNQEGWQNRFVQINTVKHITYESIVNKYALLAWVLLDESRPAFEMFTFAKTSEGFQKWLSNRESGLVWGYQQQMKKLAGIAYEAVK